MSHRITNGESGESEPVLPVYESSGETVSTSSEALNLPTLTTEASGPVSSYTVQLSSHLDPTSVLCPMETTLARIEPHGAVILFRFTSGEHVERFELSSAEVDALIATNRRRRLCVRRYCASANTEQEVFPF